MVHPAWDRVVEPKRGEQVDTVSGCILKVELGREAKGGIKNDTKMLIWRPWRMLLLAKRRLREEKALEVRWAGAS